MVEISTEAQANRRLEENGRRRQRIRDAEALFVNVVASPAGDMFAAERFELVAEAAEIIALMLRNGWACRVSGTARTQVACPCCDAVGQIGARELCPETQRYAHFVGAETSQRGRLQPPG